jgi:hypothetical protein
MNKCKIKNCRGCAYQVSEPSFRVLSKIDCVMIMLLLSGMIIGTLVMGVQ